MRLQYFFSIIFLTISITSVQGQWTTSGTNTTTNNKVGISITPRERLDLGKSVGAGNGLRIGDYLSFNERELQNNAGVIGFNTYLDPTDVSKFKPSYSGASSASGMIMTMSSGGQSNLDFYGINWGTDSTPKSLSDFTHVMRLGVDGNVGIGVTTPTAKLDIAGDIKTNAGEGFRLHGDSNYFGTNYDGVIFEIQDTNGSNAAVDGGFVFRGLTTTDNVHKDLMVIKGAGNVGIGTKLPNAKLQIINESQNSYGNTLILGENSGSNLRLGYHDDYSWIQSHGGKPLRINEISGDLILNRLQGNVGIGTDSPDSKLTVRGNIHAREIKVTITAGADFVFADDYQLPKLATVAAFVKENKHLPQIAPAATMEKDGLELGEMNIRLLQKVEELTLYTIDQENKLGEQEQELKSNKEDFEYYKKLQDQKMQILLDRLQALEQNKN